MGRDPAVVRMEAAVGEVRGQLRFARAGETVYERRVIPPGVLKFAAEQRAAEEAFVGAEGARWAVEQDAAEQGLKKARSPAPVPEPVAPPPPPAPVSPPPRQLFPDGAGRVGPPIIKPAVVKVAAVSPPVIKLAVRPPGKGKGK